MVGIPSWYAAFPRFPSAFRLEPSALPVLGDSVPCQAVRRLFEQHVGRVPVSYSARSWFTLRMLLHEDEDGLPVSGSC